MKLKNETVQELGVIVKEDFGQELSKDEVEKLAYSLVGYFGILMKAKVRENKAKFGNSSAVRIDNPPQKKENGED